MKYHDFDFYVALIHVTQIVLYCVNAYSEMGLFMSERPVTFGFNTGHLIKDQSLRILNVLSFMLHPNFSVAITAS